MRSTQRSTCPHCGHVNKGFYMERWCGKCGEPLKLIELDLDPIGAYIDNKSIPIDEQYYWKEAKALLEKSLSEKQRRIYDLYISGVSAADICDALGLPITTVNPTLHAIRKKAREIHNK